MGYTVMQRSLLAAATLTLALAGVGGAFAQSAPQAAQPAQAAPNANLIPGGAAAAAPSFMDRLAYNMHKTFAGSDSGKDTQSTRTADSH